jgi:NADH-quinone oxidoreductase subunit J
MDYLHFSINFLLLSFGFLVLISTNPVHSVLFLILSFCCAAIILVLFGLDFLASLFIIIYVGAIAVLFLFVVMMLNVKLYEHTSFTQSALIIITIFLTFFQSLFILNELFYGEVTFLNSFNFDTLYSIDIFGQVLYNYFSICFLLAGLILLVAMIGAIALTLTFKSNRKNELVFRQLARSENFLSFFH